MSSTLSIILAVLLVLIVAIIIFAYLRPKEYRLERSILTRASAADIYAVIIDLHRFREWSPWQKLDPTVVHQFAGPLLGVGSILTWDGNKAVGAGKMTITSAHSDKEVGVETIFLRPFPSKSQTTWKIENEGAQRKITWVMEGVNETFMTKVFNVFISMDTLVGKSFEEGLAKLKTIVEKN